MKNGITAATAAWVLMVLFLWGAASWITHVVVCVNESAWTFLVIGGLIFPPLGNIHGTGIWLGLW